MNKCIALFYFLLNLIGFGSQENLVPHSLAELSKKALAAPTFRDLYNAGGFRSLVLGNEKDYQKYRLVTFKQFEKVLDEFMGLMNKQLNDADAWFEGKTPIEKLADPESYEFVPYAQKIFTDPGTLFICKGDLHGDVHSLIAFIQDLQNRDMISKDSLKISNPALRLVFHGDYVDRGIWGVEVLYILMLLKINNPDNVILIRGNHEDPAIACVYGFSHEFMAKFADVSVDDRLACYEKLSKFYNFLPIVLYAGSGTDTHYYMQCNHGGIEYGYNPKDFLQAPQEIRYHWIEKFVRATECSKLPTEHFVRFANRGIRPLQHMSEDFVAITPTSPFANGFLWHDFCVEADEMLSYSEGRGLKCNKALTYQVLEAASSDKAKLSFIVRAHQHVPNHNDPLMKLMLESQGCAALWQNDKAEEHVKIRPGLVLTLLLSPDSYGGTPHVGNSNFSGFDYDTYAQIKTGEDLSKWELTVFNNQIYTQRAAAAAAA